MKRQRYYLIQDNQIAYSGRVLSKVTKIKERFWPNAQIGVKVRLVKRYDDIGFTGRVVEAGTEGIAYQFDVRGDLWKVKVWGNGGVVAVRREDLEFLGED
jgi:hypothetical protein